MPIVVERLKNAENLTATDRSYLLKVYQHEPAAVWQTAQPTANNAEEFVDLTFANPDQVLYAARFNSNYIAAAVISHADPTKETTLHALCVRDLTRRRGVGKQLLKEIAKLVDTSILCMTPDDNLPLALTLKAAGFIEAGERRLMLTREHSS